MATSVPSSRDDAPDVTVLLATFNGVRWLPEQLASILSQTGVRLRIIALDDESDDGTRDWLVEQAAAEPRLTVLPPRGRSGGAAPNFFRLLSSVVDDIPADGYVAFADQDDIWHDGKLERHVRMLREGGHDGVSSSVTAFSADGGTALVRKDFPQRRFDYLTESPGPGCTFVITPRLARLVVDELADPDSVARDAEFHDSLIYAVARARGWSWRIDGVPSVDYRQHGQNVLGSNTGVGSAVARLKLIREHWHRNEAILHAKVAIRLAEGERQDELRRMLVLFQSRGLRGRLQLAPRARYMRRRRRDQWIIGLLIAVGIW